VNSLVVGILGVMKVIDINKQKKTKKGNIYSVTRKKDNWHFMICDKNNRWLTEPEIIALDDKELTDTYKRFDKLNMANRYGFPLSPNWYKYKKRR